MSSVITRADIERLIASFRWKIGFLKKCKEYPEAETYERTMKKLVTYLESRDGGGKLD